MQHLSFLIPHSPKDHRVDISEAVEELFAKGCGGLQGGLWVRGFAIF